MYTNIFITNRTHEDQPVVYIWDDTKGLIVHNYSDFDYAYKLDSRGDKETIFGDRVSKTYRWNDDTPGIFESDVSREIRVLTDLYLQSDDIATNHRIFNFDIEVGRVGGAFASVEKANGQITSIACHAHARKEKMVFLLDEDNRFNPKQQQTGNEIVLAFDTEEEMLQAFISYYSDYSPTILTGWNINQYDIPYLYRRLAIILDQDSANMLSPIGIVRFSKMRKYYQVAGVNCLDYFVMYQKFTFARRPSYRLHDIGMFEVGMGKIEYEGTLDNLYNTDLSKFIEYNMQDVRIVDAINDKMKLIDLVINISHVGHTPYEDYLYPSKYIEGTILTYLHRQNRVVPNKRPEGRDEFNEKIESDEDGFAGAFVKPPMPGLYEWVYNLDLQSLYPSIIMSLNISPETKIGSVSNFDVTKHASGKLLEYSVQIDDTDVVMTYDQFVEFMTTQKFNISSNGILYRTDKLGVIPEILDVWFKQRLEFKKLQKEYKNSGDMDKSSYYDRRQHVQKILLNSIYGVLGLAIFRFYDLDNATAVTATGQDIIKMSSKMISSEYKKLGVSPKTNAWMDRYRIILDEEMSKAKNPLSKKDADLLWVPDDHCIYIDTDSVYFSAVDLFDHYDGDEQSKTIQIAKNMEQKLNRFYDVMARKMFFCNNHRLVIKGEAVNKTSFWVAKKRYAMWKVYDLEGNYSLDEPKLLVKGLDTVRSSFPPAFKEIMSLCLTNILEKKDVSHLNDIILKFRDDMNQMEFKQIARNTSVQNISEFDSKKAKGFKSFPKGVSAHVKASIAYNRWLRQHGMDKSHGIIRDGDKIKWINLKPNEFGIDTMALKGYDDPEELIEFVNTYLDYDATFVGDLKNKLQDFYNAMEWGLLPTSQNRSVSKFFDF